MTLKPISMQISYVTLNLDAPLQIPRNLFLCKFLIVFVAAFRAKRNKVTRYYEAQEFYYPYQALCNVAFIKPRPSRVFISLLTANPNGRSSSPSI